MISLVGVTLYAFGRSRAAVRAAVAAAREVYAGSAACDTGRGLGTRNGGFGMGEPKRRGDICAVVPLLHPSQVSGGAMGTEESWEISKHSAGSRHEELQRQVIRGWRGRCADCWPCVDLKIPIDTL